MEIRHLKSFIAVADSGGISKAALSLHLAQPAVSQHLRSLEREVGSPLFDRTSRGVQLTDAGLSLLDRARDVLSTVADFTNAAQLYRGESSSQVKVAMTPSLAASFIPEVLKLLGTASPHVHLMVHERPTQDALALLTSGAVELAVVRDAEGNGVHVTPLLEEELHLALAKEHPLVDAVRESGMGVLRDEPFLFFRHTGREVLYQGAYLSCLRAGFTPRAICQGVEVATLGELVKSGMGAAIAPKTVTRLWDQSRIEVFALDDPRPRSVAYLARIQGQPMNSMVLKIVQALTRAARRLSAELASDT